MNSTGFKSDRLLEPSIYQTGLITKLSASNSKLKKISKFLSYVLRHCPSDIGLTLDRNGWATISELIDKAMPQIELTLVLIKQIVETSDKQRFKISEDGLRIRAVQGHSTKAVAITYPEKVPPKFLNHGTATRFLKSILNEGLRPGERHYVHLSQDAQTAIAVGQRHGKPTVLRIEALRMHQQGFKFFLADNGVWLTDQVPPEFLIPDSSNAADSATTSRQPKLST